jgi:D-tyrosyl-tRNA(Tyr) deacylase
MKAVVQRVKQSSVTVDRQRIAEIGRGLLVLIGVARDDTEKAAEYLATKIVNLRIFEDDQGKFNRSLAQTGGQMLVVSQFTLLADCHKGRRPSFVEAAEPAKAARLYEYFVNRVRQQGIPAKTGQFRASMEIGLINDGPVTLILES